MSAENKEVEDNNTPEASITINWIIPALAMQVAKMGNDISNFEDFLNLEHAENIISQTSLCYIELTEASKPLAGDLMLAGNVTGPNISPFASGNKLFFTYELANRLSGQSSNYMGKTIEEIGKKEVEVLDAHDKKMEESKVFIETLTTDLFVIKISVNSPTIGLILSLSPFFWFTASAQTFAKDGDQTLIGYIDNSGLSIIHGIVNVASKGKEFTPQLKEGCKTILEALDARVVVEGEKETDGDNNIKK